MLKDWRQKASKYLAEAMKLNATPKDIAFGFSLGTFLVILPISGLHIPLATLAIFIFKKINRLALFGSFAFWNPLTLMPIYALSYKIGDLILNDSAVTFFTNDYMNIAFDLLMRFIIGEIILAVVISIGLYFLIRFIVSKYQKSNPSGKEINHHDKEIVP